MQAHKALFDASDGAWLPPLPYAAACACGGGVLIRLRIKFSSYAFIIHCSSCLSSREQVGSDDRLIRLKWHLQVFRSVGLP
jgi:hypothetical protein